jgi:AraC-like DNA-binding protein
MRHITERDPTHGILDFRYALDRFRLRRIDAAQDLRKWIDYYWIVAWDLPPGQAHRQTNVSHASINAAFEPEGSFLYGVPQRTFVREISGRGSVFGIMFRPGGFFPFHGASLKSMTGRRVPLCGALGGGAAAWIDRVKKAATDEERASLTDAYWRPLLPAEGPAKATLLAERIISDRSIVSVARAAAAAGMEVRSLQRLFHREVGIGPKEVIRRFRLREAAERLLRDPSAACGDIALDLGYFDQAHFIRDFKAVVGVPPEIYRRRQ